MANYINSKNIKTFPAAGRSENYAQSYLLSEKNLTETLRALYQKDNSSFIISEKFEAPFKFVINGRYFELDDVKALSADDDLFATIFVNKETGRVAGYDPTNAATQFADDILDTDSDFIGVYFSSAQPADDPTDTYARYSLKLLTAGKINEEAIIHLITEISVKKENRTLVFSKTASR